MSTFAQWNEFTFFDVVPIRDPNTDRPLYSDPEVIACCSGKESIWVLSRTGELRQATRDLVLRHSIFTCPPLYVPFTVTDLPGTDFVVTVATRQGYPTLISLWDFDNRPNDAHATTEVTHSTNQPLTSFSVAPDASVMALGFADGSVIVVRGDLLHDRGARSRLIWTADSAVTGLELTPDLNAVWVSSLSQVTILSTSGRGSPIVVEPTKGAALGCTTVQNGEFVVCRDAEICRYTTKHRGASFELAVAKRCVVCWNNYLIVTTAWNAPSLLAAETLRITIVDTVNKLIIFNGHLAPSTVGVMDLGGNLGILGSDGILYELHEHTLAKKIETLRAQKLFEIALRLSKETHWALELHQDYADYLFDHNDPAAALEHYIAAMDLGNTSHAILRFKDSRYATYLAQYLESVHHLGKATPQHTTLLLICYVKLEKDPSELLANPPVGFDYEAAIEILQDAKLQVHAAQAAEMWPDPDIAVQIKLRDLHDFWECLEYIKRQSVSDALRILVQNARPLLDELPVETTGLLITLFTGKFKPATTLHEQPSFSHRPVLESYQAFMSYISGSTVAAPLESTEISYAPPRPRLIYPSFVGHDDEFIIFLEACLEAAPSDVTSTLYEMYLRKNWIEKAHKLSKDYEKYIDPATIAIVTRALGVKLEPADQVNMGRTWEDVLNDYPPREALQQYHDHFKEIDASVALRRFTTESALAELTEQEFNEVLDLASNSLTSVEVIQEVCSSTYVTIGHIRPWLQSLLDKASSEISREKKISDSYEKETIDKREKLKELAHARIVKPGNCALCTLPIELPVIHFACGHSFHTRCLGGATECRLCAPGFESIQSLRIKRQEREGRDALFFEDLAAKDDKVRVVSDYIARGGLS